MWAPLQIVLFLCLLKKSVSSINQDSSSENFQKKNSGFLFSLPKTLVSGKNESVCLSLHGAKVPARAIIDLKWKERHFPTIRHLESEHSCFDLHVPLQDIKEPQYVSIRVQVQINGEIQSAHNQDPILMYPPQRNWTFIDTDRAMYRPGDTVKFRILVLDENFMPQSSNIPEIRIRNPLDTGVSVWDNVRLINGLTTLEYHMVQESLTGKWKIEVGTNSKTFEVVKYALPRFKIDLIYPRVIYYKNNSLKVMVCARYSYGKHLNGIAFIKVTDSHSNMSPINRLTQMKNGCAEFKISNSELNMANIKEKFPMYDPRVYIHLTATVTEDGTNRMDVETGKILVILKAYNMKFDSDPIFQPGLPYRGKLKLTNINTDIKNEVVEICYNIAIKKSWNYLNNEQCLNTTVLEDGAVDFTILPLKSNVIHILLNARSLNHTNIGDSLVVVRLYSPSASYIYLQQINADYKACNAQQQFIVDYTTEKLRGSENVTFYYMIKTNSGIHKLRKLVHTVKKTAVDFQNYSTNVIGEKHKFIKSTTLVDKLFIKFKIDKKFVSKYQLLVYYVRKGGETIAYTKSFVVEPCLSQVDAKWSENQLTPGSMATLNIQVKSPSICSVSAVDKATKFLPTNHQPINLKTIINSLSEERESVPSGRKTCVVPPKRSQVGSLTEFKENVLEDSWDLKRRKRHVFSFSEDYDSYDVFSKFGTVTITNLKLVTKPCYSGPVQNSNQAQFLTGQYDDENEDKKVSVRSHFPETWLWELIPVSDDVQLKRHLPHTVTNWVTNVLCISDEDGIAFANETELTSFQSFFAEIILPSSVKREEEFYITVRVSNYFGYRFPIRINIRLSNGLVLLDSPQVLSSSHCIKENGTVSLSLHVEASMMGVGNITVLTETDNQFPSECGPETLVSRKDMIFKKIQIEPEGYPLKITNSALLCGSDVSHSNNISWDITIPSNIVAGTGRAHLGINGDLLGKTLENLHKLLTIPTGCGEQIMASVAPNLFVMKYLHATKALTHSVRQKIIKNLKMGYQRILNYVHKDGSFSAFGYHDGSGSMFLTAFVVRTLQEARQYIYVDQRIIDKAVAWIYAHQLENGCFNTMFHVFQDMGGTSTENSTAGLTAYVITSLYEASINVPKTVETNAKYCIRSQHNPDKYTLAISCYSLFKVQWENEAIRLLQKLIAVSNQRQNMMWWSNQDNSESPATDVEITSYALLCLLHQNTTENLAYANGVARWLTSKIGSSGGFRSTQDTVVALDALARYAAFIKSKDLNLKVNIQARDLSHKLTIKRDDRLKSKKVNLESKNGDVKIRVTGEGCVLTQLTVSYYLKDLPKSEAFKLALDVTPVSTIDQCSVKTVSPCVSYNGPDEQSNMAVMEFTLPSGYEADRASLYKLIETNSNSNIKMFEEEQDHVNLYFTKLDKQQLCFSFNINENSPIATRKKSLIKLYDYYRPEYEFLQFYRVDQNCSNDKHELPQIMEKPAKRSNNFTEDKQSKENVDKASKRTKRENKPQLSNETLAAINATVDFINHEKCDSLNNHGINEPPRYPYTTYRPFDDINTEVEYLRKRRNSENQANSERHGYHSNQKRNEGYAYGDTFLTRQAPYVDFTDKDVEMDTPQGMEGTMPSYMKPQKKTKNRT